MFSVIALTLWLVLFTLLPSLPKEREIDSDRP